MPTPLPLPLAHRQIISDLTPSDHSFLVGGMFTPDYADRAERLRASCARFRIPYALYELAAVHGSVSPRGSTNESLTKANFIRTLLSRYKKPILYVDIDCLFCSPPTLVDDLVREGIDFAIFNWAADADNEAFVPVDVDIGGEVIRDRYFMFSHRIKRRSADQLIASGCVQLYRDSIPARQLLESWHGAVRRFPGSADDHCLSFAFNNKGPELSGLRTRWLPKEYARISSWITVQPVIDHPDRPAEADAFKPIPDSADQSWFYIERSEAVDARFSEASVIDVRDRLLYELVGGRLMLSGPVNEQFWVSWGMPAPMRISVSAIEGG